MLIKICGMKFPENIEEISLLKPDFMGFIFYPDSKRFVENKLTPSIIQTLPNDIQTVAVFVNEPIEEVVKTVSRFKFNFAQLHGDETHTYCEQLKQKGIRLIKAFSVDDSFDFRLLNDYFAFCDYFLFDTKTIDYGGSGKQFDWQLLKKYTLKKPFFLSGGIENSLVNQLIQHEQLIGIDANSRLEDEPGRKNKEKCKEIIQNSRTYEFS
jgi:phosphoribosylanthranilate isomerase